MTTQAGTTGKDIADPEIIAVHVLRNNEYVLDGCVIDIKEVFEI